MFLPWSRHIGEGDIVVSDAAKACQNLGKWCNNQVLPVPAEYLTSESKLIVSNKKLYLGWFWHQANNSDIDTG